MLHQRADKPARWLPFEILTLLAIARPCLAQNNTVLLPPYGNETLVTGSDSALNHTRPAILNSTSLLDASNNTIDADDKCASSWSSWQAASNAWYTGTNDSSMTLPAIEVSSRVIGIVSTWTESCDGIPRAKYASTGRESWIASTTIPTLDIAAAVATSTMTFPAVLPLCSMRDEGCTRHWNSFSESWNSIDYTGPAMSFDGAVADFPSAYPGKNYFGCPPPRALCSGSCTVSVERVALIHWPALITSSDLCGNDGLGSYATAPSNDSRTRVFSTDAITLYSHNFFLPGLDNQKQYKATDYVIKGSPSFTFTSPTVYMAYATMDAGGKCGPIGTAISHSIVPLREGEAQSIAFKAQPIGTQLGELEYARALANDSLRTLDYLTPLSTAPNGSKIWDEYISTTYTRPVNFAHFRGDLPAAVYYEQDDCRLWDLTLADPGRKIYGNPCATITQGRYYPQLVIPDRFKNVKPDWESCEFQFGGQDPNIELTQAVFLDVPQPLSAPVNSPAESVTMTRPELDPGVPTQPAIPAPQPAGSTPLPTAAGVPNSGATGNEKLQPYSDTSDPGTLAAVIPIKEGKVTVRVPPGVGAPTGVAASIAVGLGLGGALILRSSTIMFNGPMQTLAGHTFRLAAGSVVMDEDQTFRLKPAATSGSTGTGRGGMDDTSRAGGGGGSFNDPSRSRGDHDDYGQSGNSMQVDQSGSRRPGQSGQIGNLALYTSGAPGGTNDLRRFKHDSLFLWSISMILALFSIALL